jgi:uncharacterized lipoprotein YbaY
MMYRMWILFAGWFLSVCALNDAFSQSNWLGDFSSALPRVNPSFPSTTMGSSTLSSGGSLGSSAFPNSGLSLGSTGNRQDWRIGVGIDNRDTGAFVTQVQPGSAAQQAGIIPGDIIVGAGPNRIGLVDGRIIELAEVARNFADNFGRISLLVLDSRSRQLRNVPINMTSTATALSGSIVLSDNGFLPTDAIAIVELRNVSRPFFQVQGGRSTFNVSRQGPFEFSLNIDPRFLDPVDQYELQAMISSRNQVMYTSQRMLMRSTDIARRWDLILQPVGLSTASPGGIVNAGYPSFSSSISQAELARELQSLLGRLPMANEITAWDAFLRNGNTLASLRVRILSNPQLRSNFGNDSLYINHVFTNLFSRAPSQAELSYWMNRLGATNSPETVISEMMRP